jgi:hypothetical protein
MKFRKDDLRMLAWEEEPEGFELVESELIGHGRWSLNYEQVFMFDGKFYRTIFSKGATEQQEERPYDYEPDEIECDEVEPFEMVITRYRKVE